MPTKIVAPIELAYGSKAQFLNSPSLSGMQNRLTWLTDEKKLGIIESGSKYILNDTQNQYEFTIGYATSSLGKGTEFANLISELSTSSLAITSPVGVKVNFLAGDYIIPNPISLNGKYVFDGLVPSGTGISKGPVSIKLQNQTNGFVIQPSSSISLYNLVVINNLQGSMFVFSGSISGSTESDFIIDNCYVSSSNLGSGLLFLKTTKSLSPPSLKNLIIDNSVFSYFGICGNKDLDIRNLYINNSELGEANSDSFDLSGKAVIKNSNGKFTPFSIRSRSGSSLTVEDSKFYDEYSISWIEYETPKIVFKNSIINSPLTPTHHITGSMTLINSILTNVIFNGAGDNFIINLHNSYVSVTGGPSGFRNAVVNSYNSYIRNSSGYLGWAGGNYPGSHVGTYFDDSGNFNFDGSATSLKASGCYFSYSTGSNTNITGSNNTYNVGRTFATNFLNSIF